MAKIYLSPAVHEHDRECAYDAGCSENTHANRYLDELEVYLDANGIEHKRHLASDKGAAGVARAVKQSNDYGPDLHYVVHTNAYDGSIRGSRPQIYRGSKKGRAFAEAILNYRRRIYPYPCAIFERTDLTELKGTRAPCVYEELVFHDNREDCAWLHANLRKLAEYTCRALCEVFGIPFRNPYQGDVNGDGRVDASDALMALQDSVDLIHLNEEQRARADMDGNGKVNAQDALAMLNKSVGRE